MQEMKLKGGCVQLIMGLVCYAEVSEAYSISCYT